MCVCMCMCASVVISIDWHITSTCCCVNPLGVQGIVLEDHSLPDLQPAQRRTVYLSMMETLARLHRLPMGELELLLDPEKAYNDMRMFWNWQVCVHCMCMLLCTCCGYCVYRLHVYMLCVLLCVHVSVGVWV